MLQRCGNSSHRDYHSYGGRGISVCQEWRDFSAFVRWAEANGFQKGLSIDRIDNDGNYEPANCRWATPKEQASNKRNNVYFDIGGKTVTMSEAARICGLKHQTISLRLKSGWSKEKALQPVRA